MLFSILFQKVSLANKNFTSFKNILLKRKHIIGSQDSIEFMLLVSSGLEIRDLVGEVGEREKKGEGKGNRPGEGGRAEERREHLREHSLLFQVYAFPMNLRE